MEVVKLDSYSDGGTIEITTMSNSKETIYCIDYRMFSETLDKIYL
jgi:hypothetical protein